MTYTTTQTRTNLVANPSFETNATGWNSSGGTLTRVTTDAYFGVASLQIQHNSTGLTQRVGQTTNWLATAGKTYTGSVYLKNTAGNNRNMRVSFRWANSGGTIIGENYGTAQSTVVGGDWVRCAVTATAPATTFSADLLIYSQHTNGSVSNIAIADGAMVEETSTLRPYFDGSTAETYSGYTLTAQAWTGTANASTSVTHWGLTSTYVNNGVARFNNSFRDTQAFRQYVEVPNYAPRKVIYFASPFSNTQGFYRGITVYSRTATGSGTGTQSATRIRVKLRTASASAIKPLTILTPVSINPYAHGNVKWR